MNDIYACPICGRKKSKGKKIPFTKKTLAFHIRDAHTKRTGREDGDPTFELTDMIADDDMPDGAYFALAWELGEL